jgi:hypothetical protein
MGNKYGCKTAQGECVMLYKLLNDFRADLEERFLDLQDYIQRATYLLDESSNLLGIYSDQRARLVAFRARAQALSSGVVAAIENCYQSTEVEVCRKARDSAASFIEREHLNIAVLDVSYRLLSQVCKAIFTNEADADSKKIYHIIAGAVQAQHKILEPIGCDKIDELAKTLTSLSLNDQRSVGDLSLLSTIENLESLSLHGTTLKQIEPIEKLRKLKFLDLAYTEQSNFNAVYGLPRLETLTLNGNDIDQPSLNRLAASLPNLKKLVASRIVSNRFNEICPILLTNPNIEEIDVTRNDGLTREGLACKNVPRNNRLRILRFDRMSNFDIQNDCPAQRCELD